MIDLKELPDRFRDTSTHYMHKSGETYSWNYHQNYWYKKK